MVGNKKFYKNEPVIYFDTLKTSSMEGAATTVYAQGGRGNSRLIAWEGERTVTFTMEDALISPEGFMILSGAGLIEGSSDNKIKVHSTERIKLSEDNFTASSMEVKLGADPYDANDGDYIYVMLVNDDDEVESEPFIGTRTADSTIQIKNIDAANRGIAYAPTDKAMIKMGSVILVDYYVEKTAGAREIQITPDKFGGNYYLEASTLFRDTNGVDLPAEFVIPNCKIQSNFNFTMASSGDPSTFTFTMDAFPDYTRFDATKKVLAAIQIIDPQEEENELREYTAWDSVNSTPEEDDEP